MSSPGVAPSSEWREQEIALFGNMALLAVQTGFTGNIVDVFESTLDAGVNFFK